MPEQLSETGAQSAIDAQIAELRANPTRLPPEVVGRRLEDLYRHKIEGNRELSESESIDREIEAIRNDRALTDERRGEQLVKLYEQKNALAKTAQEPPPDPREVTSELINAWGGQYQPTMNRIAETLIDVFGGKGVAVERFKTFSDTLALDRNEQIDVMHQLADLAVPVDAEMSIDSANIVVADRLRGLWGNRADENFAAAQRAAKSIFGSLERAEEYILNRGWGESPKAQIKAFVLLSRLGRKLKS